MSKTELLSVSCNHCGAPLDVPVGVRFLTCAHCGNRLEVHHDKDTAYTQVLNNIDQRTQNIARDVEEIKARERLDQIDREWMMRQKQFMIRDNRGGESPAGAGSIVVSIAVAMFGIFWICMAMGMGAPFFFPLFGVVFVVVAIGGVISTSNKASGYSAAEKEYQQERARTVQELRSNRHE